MSIEAHIRTILENYLNLASDLQGYAQAKEAAAKKYNSLLSKHSPGQAYTIHAAAPVISAYEEIKNLDRALQETDQKLHDTGEVIKGYILALNGSPLDVHFTFDSLNHRAGIHTFYLENEALKVRHVPAS